MADSKGVNAYDKTTWLRKSVLEVINIRDCNVQYYRKLMYIFIFTGFIRDETGSYVGGFYLMGSGLVLGGLLLLFKPLVSK